jgi:nucleotidyltransferase/DNA polymerase involved in DNA repair
MRQAASILHADVDAFYASVEQRDDPRLRGRPVIVGAGVVLAASYEAKAHGVRTAMAGSRARRMCPDAVVVSPRMSAYSEASKALFKVFDQTSAMVEGLSIDEAFLDVGGLWRLSGSPEEIAIRLRRDVLDQVGLPISVGVARTKFLAKVASGVAKPDGLLVVPPDRELAKSAASVDAVLVSLVDRLSRRLRAAHRVCRTVVLRLRFDDLSRATRSRTLPEATAQTETILAMARTLMREATPLIQKQGITLVGVSLTNLWNDSAIQLALPFDRHQLDALDSALDSLRDRFGTNAITRGVLLGRSQGIEVPQLPD